MHSVDLLYVPWMQNYVRNPRQLWVYFTIESQRYAYCSLYYSIQDLNGLFNLTVTFKPQSDIVVDYRPFRHWDQVHLLERYVEGYRTAVRKQNFFEYQMKSKTEFIYFLTKI